MKRIMIKIDGKWQELAGSLAYQKYNEKDRTYEWFEVNRESIEDVSLEGEAFTKDDLRRFLQTAEGKNKELAKDYLAGMINFPGKSPFKVKR